MKTGYKILTGAGIVALLIYLFRKKQSTTDSYQATDPVINSGSNYEEPGIYPPSQTNLTTLPVKGSNSGSIIPAYYTMPADAFFTPPVVKPKVIPQVYKIPNNSNSVNNFNQVLQMDSFYGSRDFQLSPVNSFWHPIMGGSSTPVNVNSVRSAIGTSRYQN